MRLTPGMTIAHLNEASPRFGARTLRAGVRELFDAREVVWALVRRDLIVRYEHAVLGVSWALGVPLVQMAVFALVFTRVAPVATDLPYPLFAYAGLTLWSFMSSAVRAATRSLSDQVGLVTRVYFPREALPIGSVLVALVDFAVTLVPLALLMIWYGVPPTWGLVFLPVVLGILVIFTAGLSLALAMANLFYRDVRHLVEVVMLIWMFASSVVYPIGAIGGLPGRLLALNPVSLLIDAYRALLFGGALPSMGAILYTSVLSVALLLTAWSLFHRVEHLAAELA